MFKLPFFVSTINWSDISFSIHQKLLWILSANLMQDYQFKYTQHCLCFFYLEPFLFSKPTLHIKEWKGSCKYLFLFGCSLNLLTFHAPHLEVLELMTLPKTAPLIAKYHPLSHSFLSTPIWVTVAFFQAKESSGKGIEEIYFVGTSWTDDSADLMIHLLIWNSAASG